MVAVPIVGTRLRIATLVGVATLLQQACGDDSALLRATLRSGSIALAMPWLPGTSRLEVLRSLIYPAR